MKDNQANHFLLLFLLLALVIVYFIFKPFLISLIMAMIFAFLFQPIYRWILRYFKKPGISSLITTLIAVIIVVLPLSLLGTLLFQESTELYHSLVGGNDGGIIGVFENILKWVNNTLPFTENIDINIGGYVEQALKLFVSNISTIFISFAGLLVSILVFLISFYFLLKDGEKLKDYFVILSPLKDNNDEMIVDRLRLAVSATIKGSLTIGVIQGILTSIGFTIFGVPNAVLWGGVATITALIPGIGTTIVLIPAVIYLFVTSSLVHSIGLLIWGMTAVGLIDNLLGPKLVGRGMSLHPLLVFLSVLGGISFFGPLGFLLGPLTMSICIALFDIYMSLRK